MKQKTDFVIDELKMHLTWQLEAYHQDDWERYHLLEERILELEKKL